MVSDLRSDQIMGKIQRSPAGKDKARRMKAIEMMPNATLDDLASALGISVEEVRGLCQELGDERCLS